MHAVLSYLFKGLTSKVTDCFVKQMCEFCIGVDIPIWLRAVNIIVQGLVPDMLLENRSTGFFSSASQSLSQPTMTFFFPANYIIGHSWLYTPIYADTVLYINCCIKTCQMGKKYNMSKIIRLDWQMLILNMSVYIVYKRFSWALILDSVQHLCFFYEI